jgi:hypothetical protein
MKNKKFYLCKRVRAFAHITGLLLASHVVKLEKAKTKTDNPNKEVVTDQSCSELYPSIYENERAAGLAPLGHCNFDKYLEDE